MKKQIIAILIVIFTAAGLAAEKGYNGIEWFTESKKINLNSEKDIPTTNEEIKDFLRMQEQPILGVMTQVFYIFYGGCLTGVTYSINSEETPRLLEEFKNPVFETATDSMSKKEIREEGVVITNENEQMLLSILFFLEAAELQETDYRQEYKTEGTGKIYIYDYNDNTSVFIFENVIEGKTGVVYMPYIQYNFMQGRS